MLSIRIATSGASPRIARVAASPLVPGIAAVHHDDVAARARAPAGSLRRRCSPRRRPRSRVVLEQPAEAAPDQGVVVGEQDRDRCRRHARHRGARRSARVSRTSVPPSRGLRNSIVPPSSSARSRIATSPRPRRDGPVAESLAVVLDFELERAGPDAASRTHARSWRRSAARRCSAPPAARGRRGCRSCRRPCRPVPSRS